MAGENERTKRTRPGKEGGSPPPGTLELPQLRLAAPTTAQAHNVIRLATWFELRLLSPHGHPLVDERCQMFDASGKPVEKKTDKDGIVRFDNLPLLPPEGRNWVDVARPAVIFPDILEEWVKRPEGDFGKHNGERDDYRKCDGTVHFVPKLETRTDITFNKLTTEQKLQHFIDAYVDNAAKYDTAKPNTYSPAERRWNWGKGSVCNQHINFFLGYMFNYNESFTTRGSATVMSVLPLFSSDKHKFGTTTHRCYLEYLAPVTGYGSAKGTAYDPANNSTWPTEANWGDTYKYIEYIRIGRYFDFASKAPTDEGEKLIDALGDINVYSMSDIKNSRTNPTNVADAEKSVRAWLKKYRATKAGGATDKKIDSKSSTALWQIVFDLDDDDQEDRELITSLKRRLIWDHHAGVLMVRAKGGGPLTSTTKEKELWTFSADGASTPGPLIVKKKFADNDLHRKLLHLGIWRLKGLAAGGFVPAEAKDNAGKISIDLPPRFIHWG